MARSSTVAPWAKWVRASTIERPLAEFSPRTLAARNCELQVCALLKSRGWVILFHDVKIWRTQVDIVARAPGGVLTLVEVKKQSASERAWLPNRQQIRLSRISEFLAGFEPTQIRLAFVHEKGIRILPVDGLTENGDMGHW